MHEEHPIKYDGRKMRFELPPAIGGLIVFVSLAMIAMSLFYHYRRTTVAGQVFIVTRGAENVKLGAVEVLLIERAQVTDFLQKREAVVESRVALRRQELAEAEESAQKAKADYDLFTRTKPNPDLWSASRKGTILTNDFFSRTVSAWG
jgi:hypothetical protein